MFKNIKKRALNFKILRFFLIPTILFSTPFLNFNNNAKAGLEFTEWIRNIDKAIPIILQSTDSGMEVEAKKYTVEFFDKKSLIKSF